MIILRKKYRAVEDPRSGKLISGMVDDNGDLKEFVGSETWVPDSFIAYEDDDKEKLKDKIKGKKTNEKVIAIARL